MKKCSVCGLKKEEIEFNKKKGTKDGLQYHCRDCGHIKFREYYAKNKKHHLRIVSERKDRIIFRNREMVYRYLESHPCVDCGESDPVVLEFDHIEDKELEVSKAVRCGWGMSRIKREIAKCEVRCANCHRRKTAKQGGWYADIRERS